MEPSDNPYRRLLERKEAQFVITGKYAEWAMRQVQKADQLEQQAWNMGMEQSKLEFIDAERDLSLWEDMQRKIERIRNASDVIRRELVEKDMFAAMVLSWSNVSIR